MGQRERYICDEDRTVRVKDEDTLFHLRIWDGCWLLPLGCAGLVFLAIILCAIFGGIR